MANEQNEYENMPGVDTAARRVEDGNSVSIGASIGSPDRSAKRLDESFEEAGIPSPEAAGWSTVERLANLQSFR